MRKTLSICLLLLSFYLVKAQENSYKTLSKESNITWIGYGEIGDFSQTGTINISAAAISINPSVSGSITIDMKSIGHEDKSLQKHLKAKDFFNVKKYPTSTFTISSVIDGEAMGELTMNGITNTISFPVALSEENDRLTISAKATIDRTSFDIKYNSSSYFQDLGSYAIKNDFDLEFEIVLDK